MTTFSPSFLRQGDSPQQTDWLAEVQDFGGWIPVLIGKLDARHGPARALFEHAPPYSVAGINSRKDR